MGYDLAGGVVDLVVSPQIAGVVKDGGPRIGHLMVKGQPAACDEVPDQFAVVHHFELQAILTVVVFQHAEAVGAVGDDPGYPALPQQLNIFRGQPVKDILVAQAAQALAAALLLPAENPPGNTGAVENPGYGHGHLLVAGVEGAGAADKKEVLGFPGHKWFGFQAAGPFGSLGWGDSPRVGAILHIFKQVEELFRKTAFHLHQIAAQGDDFGHLLDADRTVGQASAAGGAGPERFVADGCFPVRSDQRYVRRPSGFEGIGIQQQVGLDGMDHLARVQGLAGRPGGAGILAAAAFGAGEGVQQVFPGVAVDLRYAEGLAGAELFARV